MPTDTARARNIRNGDREKSNIIVNAPNDQALRVIRAMNGNLSQWLTKLGASYKFNSTPPKIAKMS